MTKRLISFFLALVFLAAIPLSARYRYNPYTKKLDYYEAAADVNLGDIGDITLTGLAAGNVLYYNGTAWVNLATGANGEILTLAAGIPSWAAAGAPAAHAASHEVGGADLVDHNALTNWAANRHVVLPNTIANVLTDHNKAAHDALLIDADTVDGEHAAAIVTNARVKAHFPDTIVNILSDHNLAAHTALGLFDASSDVDHNATTNYAANQHVVLPNTIANVLSDHNLAAHTALGLFDASGDVDHDLTTNYVGNQHINWTAAASNFSTSEDFFLAWTEAADHARITQTSVTGTEDQALIYIEDARAGAETDEPDEATVVINNTGGIWALYIKGNRYFQADGRSYFNGDTYQAEDVFISWADAADHAVIAQTAVAGTEGQPLIFINDDRTGATANSVGEATIVIDADGTYAMYILDGQVEFGGASKVIANCTFQWMDGKYIAMGNGNEWLINWDQNNTADEIWTWVLGSIGATQTGAIFVSKLNPSDMTDHDNYLSPTFVITNDEGADANDYAGVVIGERTQANVKVPHYFDFYAMTGASDGSVASADEIAATFRFGDAGSAIPDDATGPGDVLFEDDVEIDGNFWTDGYRRQDTIFWTDCFDHGTVASKYQFDWDITSLNTQGAGTNTVDTTPSEITLTTDNNAIGDNEGTRTQFAIIQRARQNRTEWSLDLKQTANTQFYCGWNDSGTNAMVAAADEYVIVFFDVSDNANWQIKVGDGATEDVFTSAIAGAVAHIIHEIWVETDGTVHWAVNGTELDITGSVDNLMTASDHYLIVGQAQSVTGAAVIVVEIDYVENEKTKVH